MRYYLFGWGSIRINPLKSLFSGFFVMTAIISFFSILSLFRNGDSWLGFLYFLILLVPLFDFVYLRYKAKFLPVSTVYSYCRWRHLLFGLLGVALACWVYDLATTFYAIDIAKVAFELNPLGWPTGALGALAYYAPTVVFTYFLLFRIRERMSIYAAVPMTALALLMGSMNLDAGMSNFQLILLYVWLPTGVSYNIVFVLFAVGLVYVVTLLKLMRRQILHENGRLSCQKEWTR